LNPAGEGNGYGNAERDLNGSVQSKEGGMEDGINAEEFEHIAEIYD